MSENVGKFALGLISLVVLWIGVYWWWEPSEPPISFGTAPETQGPLPGTEPVETGPGTTAGLAVPPSETGSPTTPMVRPVVMVTPPEFEDYTVKNGDTLRSIAVKFFGNPGAGASIARANPLMDPARLKAGRVIRIPKDPANIQGRPIPRTASAGSAGQSKAPVAPKPTAERTYTVRAGDTLSAIAQDQYGSTAKAGLIFAANRDKMNDRDELKIGMVLTIPTDAQGRNN